MIALEIVLLIIAYTLLIISIFLQVICYRKNLEEKETILFSCSLLFLIVAITISPILSAGENSDSTNVFTLIGMTLVGLTMPLNLFAERIHKLSKAWTRLPIVIASIMGVIITIAYFTKTLSSIQYIIAVFLGISIVASVIFANRTQPKPMYLQNEKTDRIFLFAFLILIPILLIFYFGFPEETKNFKIGFSLPLFFILLASRKIWIDIERLSLFGSPITIDVQRLKNYALTNREQEVAVELLKGKSYKQISEGLHISIPTVKTHASNTYKKCGVKSRHELAVLFK